MRIGSPESPGLAGSFSNRAPSEGIAFRGDSGYLKNTYSDAGQNYHRSQGDRTVGKASFTVFSTRAVCGPGRPGCDLRAQTHRRCRPAGARPTRREPGANSCHWRATSGHRQPRIAFPQNARQSAFWRLLRRPDSYRIFAPACVRNAGGVAPSGRRGVESCCSSREWWSCNPGWSRRAVEHTGTHGSTSNDEADLQPAEACQSQPA